MECGGRKCYTITIMYQLYTKMYDFFMYYIRGRELRAYVIKNKIGFIGGGSTTQAIVTGMIDAGVTGADYITVCGPAGFDLGLWRSKGVSTTDDISQVIRTCDTVVFTTDPGDLEDTLKRVDLPANRLYISMIEGMSIGKIKEKLGDHDDLRIIRIVVGAGVTAYVVGDAATPDDVNILRTMFFGDLCQVVPEQSLEVVSALIVSGPAFVYLMIDSLCDGGVNVGVSRTLATRLACQTVVGGATMVQKTGKHPAQLGDDVWDHHGLHDLERSCVRSALIEAIETVTNQAIELGRVK